MVPATNRKSRRSTHVELAPAARSKLFAAATFALLFAALASQGCKFRKQTNRAFGEECTDAAQCESNLCTTAGEFCTKPCSYDRECGSGLVCKRDSSPSGSTCAKPLGVAVAGACQAPEGCSSGHCLKLKAEESGSGICTTTCLNAADCPAGMKLCDRVPGAGIIKLCLPDGASQPGPQQPVQIGKNQPSASATGSAAADRIGWVKVKNPRTTPAQVEYRVGQSNNCTKDKDGSGTRTIAAGDTWTLEARGEAWVCIRLQGSTKWWKNRVNHGQTHSWVID